MRPTKTILPKLVPIETRRFAAAFCHSNTISCKHGLSSGNKTSELHFFFKKKEEEEDEDKEEDGDTVAFIINSGLICSIKQKHNES